MPNIGPMELVVVLIIALVVLGPKKLPEVGRSVGKGLREFKNSVAGSGHDDEDEVPEHPALSAARAESAPTAEEADVTPVAAEREPARTA
jgi:sec-independent protein translocase protein TatA